MTQPRQYPNTASKQTVRGLHFNKWRQEECECNLAYQMTQILENIVEEIRHLHEKINLPILSGCFPSETHRLPFWPRVLTRELAAMYVGVSQRQFDQECKDGIWPKAIERGKVGSKNPRLTWKREDIDHAIDNDLTYNAKKKVESNDNSLDDFERAAKAAHARRGK
jgi:hypothetical protein